MRVYFGHPINAYNTELEAFLLKEIAQNFPHDWEIENPNQTKHDEGYKRYVSDGGRGMDYYFKEVLPNCDVGIFLPFRDGKWGAGVFSEAEFLFQLGRPNLKIDSSGKIKIFVLNKADVLSVEETRTRVRTPAGTIIPY